MEGANENLETGVPFVFFEILENTFHTGIYLCFVQDCAENVDMTKRKSESSPIKSLINGDRFKELIFECQSSSSAVCLKNMASSAIFLSTQVEAGGNLGATYHDPLARPLSWPPAV